MDICYHEPMNEGLNIVGIAALIGEGARSSMLIALMSGKAMTATELAAEANISKQTASVHLAKLVNAKLIVKVSQGRHRYFSLAAEDVGQLLEALMGVAQRTGSVRFRPGPRDPELRKARVCYNHLAGDLGVQIYDSMIGQNFLKLSQRNADASAVLELTRAGEIFFNQTGIETSHKSKKAQAICRPCLDWSVRRYHLAGPLGNAILNFCYQQKWARRIEGSRVVMFSARGENKMKALFLI